MAALIPMLIYLLLIWTFDRYEREPFYLVSLCFLWGALGAIVLSFIGSGILSFIISIFIKNQEYLKRVDTIVIAPLVEETMKGIFLFIIVLSRKFDNMTDGIVYGGAIGLGFGMTENFLYFVTYGSSINDWVTLVIIRTLFSAVMHCVSTATFGAFLGYAKFKNLFFKVFFPLIGILLAMFIHFVWNFSVSFQKTALLGFAFMFFNIIVFISVFSVSILNEKKIIYNELLEEVKNGLIPAQHLLFLNSVKRKRTGWIDEKIRKVYIKSAITLAFRKKQFKNSSGFNKNYYENQIVYYRESIDHLLNRTPENDKV